MTSSTQIWNWLTIGFEQPFGSLNESFYYDSRDHEFFSILAADYFLVDEEMNRASDVTTNYSEDQETTLIDKIRRIEKNDQAIISVPRLSLEERRKLTRGFVDTLADQKLIRILHERIDNQDYSTKLDFYFGNEADELTKQRWRDTKNSFLDQQVDNFLKLHNINLEHSSLWMVETDVSVTHTLKNEIADEFQTNNRQKNKKPWWRFC